MQVTAALELLFTLTLATIDGSDTQAVARALISDPNAADAFAHGALETLNGQAPLATARALVAQTATCNNGRCAAA